MDIILHIASTLVEQLQKPTLAFLIGGMVLAALGSRFDIAPPVHKFIVALLLMKVGLEGGLAMREADISSIAAPAVAASVAGIAIVFLGASTLARWRGVSSVDGLATAGLFGAVSASTLAAGMAMLDAEGLAYEGFIGALYPFMDIAALVTAVVLGRLSIERQTANAGTDGVLTAGNQPGAGSMPSGMVREILIDTFRSPAISALLLGLGLGLLADTQHVFESFYEQLFRGLLSLLMLIMGMEAWARLSELRKVAHAYVAYAVTAPFVHGAIGFALGLAAHQLTGFSAGGVVLLSVMAASSSDISGPPTLRAALPEANPSAYVGASTGLGTPVAILSIPLWIALAETLIAF